MRHAAACNGLLIRYTLTALTRDRRLVELLIQHGADLNARDEKDRSPLVFAVAAGKQDLADLLRQHGARD